jgi:hypothetical protein
MAAAVVAGVGFRDVEVEGEEEVVATATPLEAAAAFWAK